MSSLIHITSGYRPIRQGREYDKYFSKPDDRDRIIIKNGEVDDTVHLMEKVVWKYLPDTQRIAAQLKRNTLESTCRAIWEFIYNHIQYKLDKKGLEQLRVPSRSWQERATGVDCDCMSIFASSILTNLQIPHSFRITKYDQDFWQHVYIIVPITGSKEYYTIDAVLSKFNYEKPFSDKEDYPMSLKGINVAVLSGVSDDLNDVLLANSLTGLTLGETNEKTELDKIYQHLLSTRKTIAANPKLVASTDDATALLKMLDYAIQYWNTDKRIEALEILEKNEAQLNLRNGFDSLSGDDTEDDYSLGGTHKRGFFSAIKKAATDVAKGVKTVTKTIIRFNPLAIAARNGFLLAMKLNLFKMGSKLKWAYATKEQAAAKGISEHTWNKTKSALSKIENLFSDKLQGKRSALQKSILKGKAGHLNGFVEEQFLGLGEPATGASLAAASTVITAVLGILKNSGLLDKHAKVDAKSIAKEISDNPDAGAALKTIEQENADDDGADESTASKKKNGANDSSNDDADNSDGSNTGKPKPKGKGVLAFIKANPVPTAIGTSLIALGIYQVVKPKPVKTAALSGVKKHHPKHKAKKHKGSNASKHKVHIKKILIK